MAILTLVAGTKIADGNRTVHEGVAHENCNQCVVKKKTIIGDITLFSCRSTEDGNNCSKSDEDSGVSVSCSNASKC